MPEQAFANEPISGQTLTADEASPLPDSKLVGRRLVDDLAHIACAIAFAGAAYPLVVAIGSLTVVFTLFATNKLAWNEMGEAPAAIASYAVIGATIGLFWTGIVALGTLTFVYFFMRSLKVQVGFVRLGAFCGGLVGFVAIMPFILLVAGEADLAGLVAALAVGPALATVVGQIGGAWGGYRVRREHGVDLPSRTGRIQFGMRHIMVACVWIALLLTAVRLSGLDYRAVFLLLFGWLVYQAATIWIGGLLATWFRRWKAGRQTRST
jgi:hypothetical protein